MDVSIRPKPVWRKTHPQCQHVNMRRVHLPGCRRARHDGKLPARRRFSHNGFTYIICHFLSSTGFQVGRSEVRRSACRQLGTHHSGRGLFRPHRPLPVQQDGGAARPSAACRHAIQTRLTPSRPFILPQDNRWSNLVFDLFFLMKFLFFIFFQMANYPWFLPSGFSRRCSCETAKNGSDTKKESWPHQYRYICIKKK